MARRNIFIKVFTVEDILDGKLHGEILVELVVCIEVQEEVRIAGLEAAVRSEMNMPSTFTVHGSLWKVVPRWSR